jgi:hypothetical protein
MGAPLRHLVVMLSCMAIMLATAAKGGLGRGSSAVNDNNDANAHGKFESDNDRNGAAAVTTLPGFWWRALDVCTEDIVNTMDALLGMCALKGLNNACGMRCFKKEISSLLFYNYIFTIRTIQEVQSKHH